MRRYIWFTLSLLTVLGPAQAKERVAETNAEIQQLHQQLETLQREQDELKSKLEKIESGKTEQPSPNPTTPKPSADQVTSGSKFNPQISAILDGNYYNDDVHGEGTDLLRNALCVSCGHGHGEEDDHAHGGAEQGFNIREAELYFSANVDPYFEATAIFSVAEEGIETEEAYFATRGLPAGLKLKGGKFFSDIGYINNKHPHQWDFVDQNLPYQNFFDFNLQDIGVQLNWLPNLPLYTLFGVEIMQGRQERFGAFVDDGAEREALGLSDQQEGPRLFTGFFKIAPNLGYDHELQLGAWIAHNSQNQAIQEDEELGELGLDGDATMYGLDLVYKYDSPRSYGAGDFVLQTEYLYDTKDSTLTGVANDPSLVGAPVDSKTDGFYIQGRYGFIPRWQVALRYDVLGLTNKVSGAVNETFDSSDRWTVAVSWTPTEYSRFRLQAARADILTTEEGDREKFNYVYLQYIISIGSHGAHRF